MNLNSENNEYIPYVNWKPNYGVNGLNAYLKFIEHHYFSQVSLRNYTIKENEVNIALDMVCSITLMEMISHFNKSRWGNSLSNSQSPLKMGFDILMKKNTLNLDIDELTLFLKDTSIVIKKIGEKSVLHQFNNIIAELSNHHIYFTKGLTERPYEIFVPVFEDNYQNEIDTDTLQIIENKKPQSYFDFWGIYLDSHDDALIYDLNKNIFIPAELELAMY